MGVFGSVWRARLNGEPSGVAVAVKRTGGVPMARRLFRNWTRCKPSIVRSSVNEPSKSKSVRLSENVRYSSRPTPSCSAASTSTCRTVVFSACTLTSLLGSSISPRMINRHEPRSCSSCKEVRGYCMARCWPDAVTSRATSAASCSSRMRTMDRLGFHTTTSKKESAFIWPGLMLKEARRVDQKWNISPRR